MTSVLHLPAAGRADVGAPRSAIPPHAEGCRPEDGAGAEAWRATGSRGAGGERPAELPVALGAPLFPIAERHGLDLDALLEAVRAAVLAGLPI